MKYLKPLYFYESGELAELMALCPACNVEHGFILKQPDGSSHDGHPSWTWNGNWEKPTFSPSMLANKSAIYEDRPLCHSFLREGQWHFLKDSTHKMAGKVIDMVLIRDKSL